MPAEIVTGSFCASWFGAYSVPGSKPGTLYRVTMNGGESMPTCYIETGPNAGQRCPAMKYFKGPQYDAQCKHIKKVHDSFCGWNCQWSEGNKHVTLRPEAIDERSVIPGEACPNCGGPTCAVRIAV